MTSPATPSGFARRHRADARDLSEQVSCQCRCGLDEVLAVVENHELGALAQSLRDGAHQVRTRPIGAAERRGHRSLDVGLLVERCQLAEPDAVEPALGPASRLNCQAGLTDSAGTCECHEARCFEQGGHFCQFLGSWNEARQVFGEIVLSLPRRCRAGRLPGWLSAEGSSCRRTAP